jgi:hypothetical protein
MLGPEGRWIVFRTRQKWKIVISLILILIGVGIYFCHFFKPDWDRGFFPISLMGAGVGCIGILFAWLTIRCPRCHAHWLWMAHSEQPHRTAEDWFLTLVKCPRCGYDGPKEKR